MSKQAELTASAALANEMDTPVRQFYCKPVRDSGALFFSLSVVGKRGAVEFQFTIYPSSLTRTMEMIGVNPYAGIFNLAGLEVHRREGDGSPDHVDCRLIGSCWHDGSSLQAIEQVIPTMMSRGSDGVYELLEGRYAAYFDGEQP